MLFFFLAIAILYLLFRISRRHLERCAEKLPGETPLPIFGNSLLGLRIRSLADAYDIILEYGEKFKSHRIHKFWSGPQLFVITWDPKHVETLAVSPQVTNKGFLYHLIFGEVLNGAFVSDGGQRWRELRKPITKSITKKLLYTDYLQAAYQKSVQFTTFLLKNRINHEFDVLEDITNLFLDIFAETHLGVNLNEVEENRFGYEKNISRSISAAFQTLLKVQVFLRKSVLQIFCKSSSNSTKEVHNFLQWILDERRSCLKHTGDNREYYPDYLLKRSLEKRIPEDLVRKELHDFIYGATDIPAPVVSSALVFLAMHPEVQEKAYLEQAEIFGSSNREPTPEDLTSMQYLGQVISETLRHVSPVYFSRYVAADLHLGEYTIPKGSYISVNAACMHKDPGHWERPLDFYPDHFLPEAISKRHKYAFLPFGFGTRSCPGFQYAELVMKIVISALLRKYRLSTNLKFEDLTYFYLVISRMKCGYLIKFNTRNV